MEYRYIHLNKWFQELLKNLDSLETIFNELLLAFSGNVDDTVKYLKYLQDEGYFQNNFNIDDFLQFLEKQNFIS
ncbi:MAG: hypothetical protein HY606_00850, partial [Planctomycetes bacterium]|nr:hypothetical protein [Planctomycetota bacterium]